MRVQTIFVSGLLLAVIGLSACGKNTEEKKAEEAAKEAKKAYEEMYSEKAKPGETPQDMAAAMEEMQKAMTGGETVKPVNFRDLKKLLPESVLGMRRSNYSGERTGAFGINVSVAEAKYLSDDGKWIEIKITDLGSMKGYVAMAAAGWAMAEIDKESDEGYERTSTYKGHKAFEKYNSRSEEGEFNLFVANRFIIEANGNVDVEILKKALDPIDVGELEKMKDYGLEKTE